MKLIPNTFKARIIASVMLLHTILIGIVIVDISYVQINSTKKHIRETANTLVATIAANAPSWLISNDLNALSELISTAKKANMVNNIYIMDRFGVIKASTDTNSLFKIMDDNISLVLSASIKNNKQQIVLLEHDNVVDTISSIKVGTDTVGYVRVIIDNSATKAELNRIYKNGLFYIFIAIFIGGLLAYLAIKSMLTQMEKLSAAAIKISEGNEDVKIETTKNDNEVNRLAIVFAKMVSSLKEKINQSAIQQEQLKIQANELEELNKNLKALVETETNRRIEQEHMLLQQNKLAALGEMIGAIAHQWRQPLNSLGLSIQDISYAKQFNELDDNYIDKFQKDSMNTIKRLSSTIDDFRNFFKPNKEKKEFFIEDVIASTINIVEAQFKNNFIKIEFDKTPKYRFFGFEGELGQVILNILSNAKDAINNSKNKDNGVVKISTTDNKSHVVIEISDNGGGIPPNVIERIFEPYYSTKEQGKGVGIGLYMSKEIVERHMNGTITAHNNDEGAVFRVELPKTSTN